MMDGRVGAIRAALDAAGYPETPILSYAAEYASAFYGPFREAAESTPQLETGTGIRWIPRTPRRRYARSRWISPEGADAIMVKPAGPYLGIAAPREGRDAVSLGGVPGGRRVRDDQGRGRSGMDRRERVDDGVPDWDPSRRGGLDPDVFRHEAARGLRDGLVGEYPCDIAHFRGRCLGERGRASGPGRSRPTGGAR